MPLALILSRDSLEQELGQTVLWRRNTERRLAQTLDEARRHVAAQRPDIIVVDQSFPDAAAAVAELRQDARTRSVSMVALARGDFDSSEIELIQAGVNAILRLPESYDAPGQMVPVVALNLSVNGMLVESTQPLALGEDVQFTFHLPDSSEAVAGTGTVVRQADGSNQFGIELTHVQGDGRVRIKNFVESGND